MEISVKIFLLCIIPLAIHCAPDYYWRDWNGTAPSDAFVAATDSRGPLYLAQAYVYNRGLFVGHILSGQKSIAVNPSVKPGVVVYSDVLKVFCSRRNTFMWLSSKFTQTPNLLKYTLPVIGGINTDNETVYVGKSSTGSYSYIGNIHTDYFDYFVDESGSWTYNGSYELLIHEL